MPSLNDTPVGPQTVCIIIPTYNNAAPLAELLPKVLAQGLRVLVVNDGSTDQTAALLQSYAGHVDVLTLMRNSGKGVALRLGFKAALAKGFTHAITLDSDGQHYPSDIPAFLACAREHPRALIVGSRSFHQEHMPAGNTFANRFSNFWFAVQTGHRLPDTQTGYRMYPLKALQSMHLFTSRYETELELLVRLAWRRVSIVPLPVHVYYAPRGEQVSHFRRGIDFFRISVLNTVLCLLALCYGYPSMLLRKTW